MMLFFRDKQKIGTMGMQNNKTIDIHIIKVELLERLLGLHFLISYHFTHFTHSWGYIGVKCSITHNSTPLN